MQYGIIQLAKPRVVVLRGFDPNEPTTLTQDAPIAAGVTIKSGQVISLTWNGTLSRYEWVLGCSGVKTPYIALQTGADSDVAEAEKLTGLSCAGKFEIRTPFYKVGDTYNTDVVITYDGVTGDVKAALGADYTTGALTTAGDPVLGVITRIHGPVTSGKTDSSAVAPITTITFTTAFQPFAANF